MEEILKKLAIYFFYVLLIANCVGNLSCSPETLVPDNNSRPDQNPGEGHLKERLSYLTLQPGTNKNSGWLSLTFAASFSNHYRGTIPKATILGDYPTRGGWNLGRILIVANLGAAFEEKLPAALKNELAKHNLLGKMKVDIFWVAQSSNELGEKIDHDNVPTTTRLKPHAWADPDAPAQYPFTRVNRNFLLGIFDTERDISTAAFPLETMTASPIHTHDSVFSPRPDPGTDMVKIGSNDPSQSFWSLVIDNNNPEGKIRAIATLHWTLKRSEVLELQGIIKKKIMIPGTARSTEVPNVATFGELLNKINNSAGFKDTAMVKKLNLLFD